MDKSIILQQKVRDNSKSLQDEFFDLKFWEEEMKKNDKKIQDAKAGKDEELPPIRKKKITKTSMTKTKDNETQSKRIKSHDYASWDQFDVEKACDEIEKDNKKTEEYEEVNSEEEFEKNHEMASKKKILGNKYVKEQKWEKALSCYSEAIKIFPFDAVFFANRAMCHLKMNNFYSTEADCTTALQLDGNYIKAYHRRATARMELKQFDDAIDDLKQILSLEKNNKEAQKLLEIAQKAFDKKLGININKKPVNKITKSEVKDEIIKKKIEVRDEIVKTKSDVKDQIIETKSLKDTTINIEDKKPKDISKVNKIEVIEKCDTVEDDDKSFPDWLPCVEKDVEVVKVIDKLPHQRSKKPLKSITIVPKDLTKTPTQADEKVSNINEEKVETIPDEIELQNDIEADVPPVPTSSIKFLETWKKYKSPNFRYKYLKQINPELIPKIFKDCMDSDTFSEIFSILTSHFIKNQDPVFNYIKFLSKVKRFQTLIMFISEKDKKDLISLFDYCKTTENQPDENIKEMSVKYEL